MRGKWYLINIPLKHESICVGSAEAFIVFLLAHYLSLDVFVYL